MRNSFVSRLKPLRAAARRMPVWVWVGLGFVAVMVVTVIASSEHRPSIFNPASSTPRIAIGGGNYKGLNNSNTLQSLNLGYARGFRTLLVSLSWTTDGKLVCMADWGNSTGTIFKPNPDRPNNQPMSLDDFLSAETFAELQPCTFAHLNQWINEHPDTFIAIDSSHPTRVFAYNLFKNTPAFYQKRIIPIVHLAREIVETRRLDYEKIIWQIDFLPPDQIQQILDNIKNLRPYAVAIPLNMRNNTKFIEGVAALKIPLYAIGVNDCGALKELQNEGFTEIFTDTLTPTDCQ